MIEYRQTAGVFRSVDEPGGPYRAILHVAWLAPDTVYLWGLHGEMTIADYRETMQQLRQMGARRALELRRGTMRERTL